MGEIASMGSRLLEVLVDRAESNVRDPTEVELQVQAILLVAKAIEELKEAYIEESVMTRRVLKMHDK